MTKPWLFQRPWRHVRRQAVETSGGKLWHGGNGGVPCGGVILIAGGALTVSTSMAVGVAGVAGGGGAEDFGVVEVTGGTGALGVGKEAGGEPVAGEE